MALSSTTMKQPYANSRSAAMLTLLSVLSPVAGLAMEMTLAWRYGASGMVDAFRVAALLGSLGLALFFGYLLPHVVVPMFADCRAKGMEQEAWRLAFTVAVALSAISLPLIGWVWFYPEMLAGLLGPGLSATGQADAELLLRCFGLAFLLMAWAGVASGILHAYRVFWPAALAQLLPNICIVLSVLLAGEAAGAGVLAFGLLLGYAAALVPFVHGLSRIGKVLPIRLAACLRPASAATLRQALHLSLPLLATILVGQWGIVVVNRALSEMPPGTLADFGYAWKLLMLAGLLPAALATVIFPAFSDAHANRDTAELSRLAMRALRMTLLLTLPLAMFLWVERTPLVGLIFGRGGMSEAALDETGRLFAILLVGAPVGALGAALSKVAFSMQDTKSPAVVALLSAIALTLFVPGAAESAGAEGVMWAFSLVSWGGGLGMLGYQIVRYRLISVSEVIRYSSLLSVLSVLAVLPVMMLRAGFAMLSPGFAWVELTLGGTLFLVTAYALSRLLKIGETTEIWAYAQWQVRQRPFGGNRD